VTNSGRFARAARSRRVRVGLAVLACWALVALLASWLAPAAPSDIPARLLSGARRALGFLLGALAGYRGGVWDELLARPVELVLSVPQIVVVAVAVSIRADRAAWVLVAAVVAVRWAEVARLVRAEVMRLGTEPWVLAARAIGCSRRRILWRHVLPSLLGPVVAGAAFSLGSVVLLEVGVSFLGLGVTDSWGALIGEGLTAKSPPWAAAAALGCLASVVGAAHLVGDGVCDALDVRALRRRAQGRAFRRPASPRCD
jgi:peptide/nickel transport system permease protein